MFICYFQDLCNGVEQRWSTFTFIKNHQRVDHVKPSCIKVHLFILKDVKSKNEKITSFTDTPECETTEGTEKGERVKTISHWNWWEGIEIDIMLSQ